MPGFGKEITVGPLPGLPAAGLDEELEQPHRAPIEMSIAARARTRVMG
ncbi:MAG TPA: hypothetical protein VF361_06310 [Candidatus Limnocylindrales bacterium]